MPAFVSPVDPAAWTFAAAAPLTIPAGLRYSGYMGPGLAATIGAPADIRMPATGILRRQTDSAGRVFVEVIVNPFPIRHVAVAIAGGVPTFYLVFGAGVALAFANGETEAGGNILLSASSVTILAVGQDRLMLD